LPFYRKRYVQFYFWVVVALSEPEFSASRIAFAKICSVMTVLDDLYDTYGTFDQLKIFTEGVRRWDASLVEGLPDYMKIAFEFWLKTANELTAESVEAVEAVKGKGQDMAAYIRKIADAWKRFVGAYLQDTEWLASGHIPTFDEYVKNAEGTVGMALLILIPNLLIGQFLPIDILEKIDFPSRIHHLLGFNCRLLDDARDFKVSNDNGDVSCIDCYLKDHPESTAEDALNHVNGIIRNGVAEMNWEFLKHDSVPLLNTKYNCNALARGAQFIYYGGDGFSTSNKVMKQQVQKVIIDPVPM